MAFLTTSNNKYSGDSKYSRSLGTPTYEPSSIKVDIKDCFDTKWHDTLISKINNSTLSEEKKAVYRKLATKFIIFNYSKVAEYYCNCKNQTEKDLFEKMAMVIVGIKKAIKLGLVRMDPFLEYVINNDPFLNGKVQIENKNEENKENK